MVYESCALDLWWFVRIILGDLYGEVEGSRGIVTVVRGNGNVEVHEIIWIWEGDIEGWRDIELVDIFLHTYVADFGY